MTKPKARTGDVIPPVRKKPQVAIEEGMTDSVIFSLIDGPVAVTLGCWLFFAIEALANEELVVRVLNHKRRRFHRRRPGGDWSLVECGGQLDGPRRVSACPH
jgi:hypothetical protein